MCVCILFVRVEIVAEGKTSQLVRFVDWLRSLETDLVKRKPSFQGPQIVIKIEEIGWSAFDGSVKGFQASERAPVLQYPSLDGEIDAKSMMGTDESV